MRELDHDYRWQSYNAKEPETLDWLGTMVEDGGVFFDVGANIGLYSLYAALRHPGLAVVAFEPEYANLHLLRDNVILNGLGNRIEVYSIALGDRSGLSRLHIQDLTPGAALHTESAARLTTTEAGERVVWAEGVWVTTVDDFCALRGLWPTAMKIDVDGGEARILSGAREALGHLRTVLVEAAEDSPTRHLCEHLLREAGLTRVGPEHPAASGNQMWARQSVSHAGKELGK